jgi:uncharacterized protein YacL
VIHALRVLFALLSIALGFAVGALIPGVGHPIYGALLGLASAAVVIVVELVLVRGSTQRILLGVFGLALGVLLGTLVGILVGYVPSVTAVHSYVMYGSVLVFGYLGLMLGLSGRAKAVLARQGADIAAGGVPKVLDTSVIIDGRVAEITQTKFIDGTLIVPRFVLQEVQYIADSADAMKRVRGRRGLEILKRLREQDHLKVVIDGRDFPGLKEVDSKLLALAKQIGARVLTNDYNLNKVASLQGVSVLNINELVNALRPVFLPGEELRIRLMKRGKGVAQGVGYLDDGTMVVVDEGSTRIGRTVDVVVTSTIQTSAGRMVFGRLKTKPGAGVGQ